MALELMATGNQHYMTTIHAGDALEAFETFASRVQHIRPEEPKERVIEVLKKRCWVSTGRTGARRAPRERGASPGWLRGGHRGTGRAVIAITVAYGAVATIWAFWIASHFTSRIRDGVSCRPDARCDRCKHDLGPWRQLPILGTIAGCAKCGATGGTPRLVHETIAVFAGGAAGALHPLGGLVSAAGAGTIAIALARRRGSS